MKIFVSPGVTFDHLPKTGLNPPAILSGLSDAALLAAFDEFVPFLDSTIVGSPDSSEPKARRYRKISLERAMRDYCVVPLIEERIDDPNLSLHELIIRAYQKAQSDPLSLYLFNLYLYYLLMHFLVWYCHTKDNETSDAGNDLPVALVGKQILSKPIRKYVQGVLENSFLHADVKVSKEFYDTPQFRNSFIMDMTLTQMLNRYALDHLRETDGNNKHIYLESRRPLKKESDIWRAVRTDFVKTFRKTIPIILEEEIRQLLSGLVPATTTQDEILVANKLIDGYKSFATYAVGDGNDTVAFFAIYCYGLIFFGYKINKIDNYGNHTFDRHEDIALLNNTEKDIKISVTYLGVDNDFKDEEVDEDGDGQIRKKKNFAPKAVIRRDSNGGKIVGTSAENMYQVLEHRHHYPEGATGALPFPDDIGLAGADEMCADLVSSQSNAQAGTGVEEMLYIVFKHRLSNPMSLKETVVPSKQTSVPSTSSFALSTSWTYPDNQFHMPASALPGAFPGQAADIASLISVLAADSEFEAFGVLNGLGIGKSAPPGIDGVPMRRDVNQNDRPPAPGDSFPTLRYSHGLLKWYRDQSGRNGWLIFYAKGFVSPLRCTWDTAPPGGNKVDLDALVTPFVPLVGGARSYNCALSAFRAFCIFEDMVRAILLHAKSQLSPAAYDTIETKLLKCLKKETSVDVILPNGVRWPSRPLNYDDISKFY